MGVSASAPALNGCTAARLRSRKQQLREAVLLAFSDSLSLQCSPLFQLTARQWQPLLRWLDISGLALYFLDRLADRGVEHLLPPQVRERLRQNLADNRDRMRAFVVESQAIHLEFQRESLSYATLKGISLWPHSVPRLELRSQLDLDFLIGEESAATARRILERRGYHLHAISGRSWEFKTGHLPASNLKNLYRNVLYRSIELHLDSAEPGESLLGTRTEIRSIEGMETPVLTPAEVLVGQGLHLYKHIRSEFSRAAHLLEFRRHVLARREDEAFWRKVRCAAGESLPAALALGFVTLLATQLTGPFAPESLTDWTVRPLPEAASLWVRMYGSRAILTDFPGTKLYLLLQGELGLRDVRAKRSLRQALLPLRLPPPVAHAAKGEQPAVRLRYQISQLRFFCLRSRFHLVEGLRYLWELPRWRRRVKARQ